MKAVVLLSGGLDSATTLAVAKNEGFDTLALTVSYGQKHAVELEAAIRVANQIGCLEHHFIECTFGGVGGSALTSTDITVPKGRTVSEMTSEIPVTYVPARNTILLALALSFAEARGANHIYVGVNAVDYSGYPDCRPEFIEAFERLANVATKAAVESPGRSIFKLHAPLMSLTKRQIIELGLTLGVDYSITHSCYDPTSEGLQCGQCDSCLIRQAAFDELGIRDPAK